MAFFICARQNKNKSGFWSSRRGHSHTVFPFKNQTKRPAKYESLSRFSTGNPIPVWHVVCCPLCHEEHSSSNSLRILVHRQQCRTVLVPTAWSRVWVPGGARGAGAAARRRAARRPGTAPPRRRARSAVGRTRNSWSDGRCRYLRCQRRLGK